MVVTEKPLPPAAGPDLDRRPLPSPPPAQPVTAQGTPRRFRPDIQGLRAIAVLLVVLYHAHVPGMTGGYVGVDVFFVISGFLITGQLVREADREGGVSFKGFYARRARRLLLPAALVVVVTLAAARVWGSVYQFKGLTEDAIINAVYGLNYRLAAAGIDYQQADGPQSPLQHFWSLAVEEQFYALWPLLIAAAVMLGGRRRWPLLAAVLVALTALSLAFSATLTATNAPYAYFSLHTRAWELGAGALLALAAARLARLPGPTAAALSWGGIGLIVWSGVAFDDTTPFPGTAALLPVVGTGLVIAAGCAEHRRGAEALLARWPMQGIGKVSYAWYLWHWPLLVLVPVAMGKALPWPGQLGLMVVALVLAALTYALVERPALRSSPRPGLWLGTAAGVMAGMVAFSLVLQTTMPSLATTGTAVRPVALDSRDLTAGKSQIRRTIDLSMGLGKAPSNMTPTIAEANRDRPTSNHDGCFADFLVIEQPNCVYGDPSGDHALVLFGDSHAQQWEPALDGLGKRLGWKVMSLTKSSCPIADVTLYEEHIKRRYTECATWRERTLRRIERARPDVVVLSQSDDVPGQQLTDKQWADATVDTARRLRAAGIRVTYLLDTPVPGTHGPECVANNLNDVTACARPRDRAFTDPERHKTMATSLKRARAKVVEPVNWFCGSEWCPLVVANLLVYRDRSHMSTAYSKWLAPMLHPIFVARG